MPSSFISSAPIFVFHYPTTTPIPTPSPVKLAGFRGDSYMKRSGVLIVSLRSINQGTYGVHDQIAVKVFLGSIRSTSNPKTLSVSFLGSISAGLNRAPFLNSESLFRFKRYLFLSNKARNTSRLVSFRDLIQIFRRASPWIQNYSHR